MIFWEKLTHQALLGTAKQPVDITDIPPAIQEVEGRLAQDQEGKLLQIAALALNFDRAGKNALPLPEGANTTQSKAEQLPYCSERAASVLEDLLMEKRSFLAHYWLHRCNQSKQIVPPNILPTLLHFGKMEVEHRELIKSTVGNRGLWLSHQNPAWHYLLSVSAEEDWEHGNMEERKRALRQIRQNAPLKALEMLQSAWAEESATQRLEYLLILEEGLSLADEEFLKSKLHDRSGKVKTEALRLLRSIPDSEASQQVWDSLSALFSIKQKKKAKENAPLEIAFYSEKYEQNEQEIEEIQNIQTTLTEQEKAQKEKVFQEIMDLVKIIPTSRWEAHFSLPVPEIIAAFANTPKIRKYLTAMIESAIYYQDIAWAKALLNHESGQDARLLAVLPYQDREKYAIHLVKNETDEVIERMINPEYQEWSLTFSQKLMEVAITDVYSFNKEFFKRIIPFLHFDINNELLNYSFPDDYRKGYWKGTATEVSYLLGLREEVKQVFV